MNYASSLTHASPRNNQSTSVSLWRFPFQCPNDKFSFILLFTPDMAIFDALRHVTTYLKEAHQSGRHHLADLYELVQYAGNIVPRLYLMVTVGSVYMEMPDAPVKEIMRDMMEMTRGVQHPTRGLFLRYYLSGQTRNGLPLGSEDG